MAKLHKVRSRTSVGAVRSTDSENAIVAAAAKVLEEHGFDGFTIDAVAREARASKPTIYRWWGNKIRLIFDAHFRTQKVAEAPPDTGSLRSDLTFLLQRLWNDHWSVRSNAMISRALLAHALVGDDVYERYRDEYVSKRAEIYMAVFERAQRRGEIPANCELTLLWEVLLGFTLYRLAMRNPMSDDEIASFLDILLAKLPTGRTASPIG